MIKDFKLLVKIVAVISNISSMLLIFGLLLFVIRGSFNVLLFSVFLYVIGNLINRIIWRCPHCRKSLPYGVYTHKINICEKCKKKL